MIMFDCIWFCYHLFAGSYWFEVCEIFEEKKDFNSIILREMCNNFRNPIYEKFYKFWICSRLDHRLQNTITSYDLQIEDTVIGTKTGFKHSPY